MALKFNNIHFTNPEYLIFLLLPLIFMFFTKKSKNQLYFTAPNLTLLSKYYHSKKAKLNIKKFLYFYFCYFLLNIALTNPNIVKNNHQTNINGYDLMILIDLSNSMAALDFSNKEKLITRLDISKKTINNFINNRTSDRIGIIIFGKYAYLESPLTIDQISLKAIIENLEIGQVGFETAIGDAITLAVDSLHKKTTNSQAIILLTDGENTAGYVKPIIAAKLAKEKKIPIFSIGIGGDGEAPFIDNYGQLQYANIPLDVKTLKEISYLTEGKFYNAKSPQELENIYKEIAKLTKSEITEHNFIKLTPIYHYFIILSLIFSLLYFIIAIIKNNYVRKFPLQ